MKKTSDLLNEVVNMGFDKDEALEQIDAAINSNIKQRLLELLPAIEDEILNSYETLEDFIVAGRPELKEEEISEELYNDILFGFVCESEENE